MSADELRADWSIQRNDARQDGRVYAVQQGGQINVEHLHLTVAAQRAEQAVSVAPPIGRRDPRRPLRGRDPLVASLWSTMRAPAGVSRVQVLCGLAGSGKTSLALELAYRAAAEGVEVWWVDGSTEHSATGGLLAVARRAGVPAEALHHGDAADQLWHCLHHRATPWLLVLDQVDRPEVLAGAGVLADGTGWLRPVTRGRSMVVLTSRDGDPQIWGGWCGLVPVGMLAPDDAARVLTDYAGRAGSPRAARQLAERLGCLPVALRMCGAYLAGTADVPWPEPGALTTFDGYLAAIEAGSATGGAAGSIADRHRQVIGRAWELSLDLLAERGLPHARPLLRVLSYLADAPVPYRLLLDPAGLAESATFEGVTASYLWRVLQGLARLGLVDLHDYTNQPTDGARAAALVQVHPLVRQASRSSADEPPGDLPAIAAGLLVRAAAGGALGAPHDPLAWPVWQAVTVHALHLAASLPNLLADGQAVDPEQVIACATDAVRHLRARGLLEAAEPEYRRLRDTAERLLPGHHPLLARIHCELGYALYYQGRLGEADQQLRAALTTHDEAVGADHPDILLTRHALARVARTLGRYAEAESELRQVHEAQLRLLGADHPDTLMSHHQLARALLSLDELDRARAEFQRVLWRQRRLLGPEHPDTLLTRHQLANVAFRQGRYAATEHMSRAISRHRERALGEHHPDTLHSRHLVGRALAAQGRWDAADKELREVLKARSRVLGQRHPDSLTTQQALAGVLAARGQTEAAIAEYRQVLEHRRRLLGDTHPDTRLTQTRLADLDGDQAP